MHKSQLHILSEIKPVTSFYHLDGYVVQISGSKGFKTSGFAMWEDIWICRKVGNFRKRDCLMEWIRKWIKGGRRKGWRKLERQRPNRTFGSLFRFTFPGVWIKEEAQHKSRAGGRVAFTALTLHWCSFTKWICGEVLIPSPSVNHQSKRRKRQKGRQKA